MRHRHDCGKWRAAALALVLALPCHEPRAEELALLELWIDGHATRRVEAFQLRDGDVYAKRSLWRELGVGFAPGAAGDDAIGAMRLPGVQATLDLGRRTLALNLPPDPSALSVIDRGSPADVSELDYGSGALLNYDLSRQQSGGRTQTAGLLEARWFNAGGVLEHSMVASDADTRPQRRLNTTYTLSDPQRVERVRIGDVVTSALAWVRPLRLAGVQVATDFTLRPGLVTSPTPQLGGNAAVPSTVDVLVNGIRQLSEPVAPGRFEVRQMPMVNGLGAVSVVTRDALGRETVQSLSFYASNRLLAAGTSAYAFDAGMVRHGFGASHDRYDGSAATASWRRGLSETVTLETHGELTQGTVLAGVGALANLGFGLAGGALALSQRAGRRGGLASIFAERQTPVLSLNLALTAATAGYRDAATAQGDAPLRLNVQASAGWQLGRNGSVGVAMVMQKSDPRQRAQLVSATYSRTLFFGAQAYLSAYRDFGRVGSNAVSVGLTVPFGGRGAASSMLTRSSAGTSLSAAAGESATTTGEAGWRVQADTADRSGPPSRQLLQASYLAPAARLSAEVERLGGAPAIRLSAQGALLALGGGLHATQTVDDSVALVEVDGQPGVSVFHQNRLVGRTDGRGQIVVPGLLSFQPNRLAIELLDLPFDAEPVELVREVHPADHSGLRVRFALDRRRSTLVVLRDAKGEPLPAGARVRGSDEGPAPAVVGHDGQTYLRGLSDENRLAVDWGTGRCTARVVWSQRQPDTGRIGPVLCE